MIIEWVAFLLTVFCAVVFHWEAKDIIWGLWISSLCVGYAFILRVIIAGVAIRPKEFPLPLALGGGAFLLAFFTFHFGMFHFVHSIFLNLFFPLIPGPDARNAPDVLLFATTAFKNYWPVVLANLLVKVRDFQMVRFDLKKGGDLMTRPYTTVVKIHVLIFIFAGMAAFHIDRFAMYPILFPFFFPMGLLKGKRVEEEPAPGSS